MLSVKCLGLGPLESLLDENLGQLFPTSKSSKTSPWRKAGGGLGLPVSGAPPTQFTSKAISFPTYFLVKETTKNLEPLNSLHHHSQSPTPPPSLTDLILGGSESITGAVTIFEICKWVTWFKGNWTLVEDNELVRDLETCNHLLARNLSGFLFKKTFKKRPFLVGGMVMNNFGRLSWRTQSLALRE